MAFAIGTSTQECTQFGSRAEEIFKAIGGRDKVDEAHAVNDMPELINPGSTKRRKAAKEKAELSNSLQAAKNIYRSDKHVRPHLNHVEHDHAQCMRQLRLEALKSGKIY